ncbi:hypothetical protein LTR95_005830 [Oleoguttula sp. CCFEE 5521]
MAALTEGQIRLLDFRHDSSDNNIRLKISTHDRAQAPPYTALSYEGGSWIDLGFVEVNEATHSVRRNLYNALAHLPYHMTGPFWVDALCIDQENTEERNHQVRAMGEIYGGAALVVAWFGLIDNAGRPCFTATGRESLEVVRAARRALVRKKYWTRLWVYQELILAQEIKVACGSHHMTHTDLATLLWNVDGEYDAHRICYAVARGPTYDLCEALAHFSTCKRADGRDRIFAILSIVAADERETLLTMLPEYSAVMAHLVEVARVHIRHLRSRGNVSEELVETALDVLARMRTASLVAPNYSQGLTLESVRASKRDMLARAGMGDASLTDQCSPPAALRVEPERSRSKRPAEPAFNPG